MLQKSDFTREEAEDVLKELRAQEIPDRGNDQLVLYVPAVNCYFALAWGTGDNLLDEDVEAGYDDYIDVQAYEDPGCEEFCDKADGGMFLFKRDEVEELKLTALAFDTLEFCGFEHCPVFKPVGFNY